MGKSKWAVLALAAAVGLVSQARADTVTANLAGVDSTLSNTIVLTGKTEQGGVGLISWNAPVTVVPSNSPYAALFGTGFGTYCIDIPDNISGGSYTYSLSNGVAALAAAPQPSSGIPFPGMGLVKATEISDLYGSYYNGTLVANDGNADTNSIAFQLAIWSIIYGNSIQSISGPDITPAVTAQESNYLANLGTTPANGTLVVMTGTPSNPGFGTSTQDQLFFVPGGPILITSGTPLPSAALGGGVLLAGLGLANWRRNRLAAQSI